MSERERTDLGRVRAGLKLAGEVDRTEAEEGRTSEEMRLKRTATAAGGGRLAGGAGQVELAGASAG